MHTVGIVLAVIGALVLFWLQWQLQVAVLREARKSAPAGAPRKELTPQQRHSRAVALRTMGLDLALGLSVGIAVGLAFSNFLGGPSRASSPS